MDVKKQVSLADYTTLRAGGTARYLFSVASASKEQLIEALSFAEEGGMPVHILGGGSNTLFSDKGFPGVVIHMGNTGMSFIEDGDGVVCIVEAGEEWNDVVKNAVERGLYGVECLAAIPGTVGGALVQNIGAYGHEVQESVVWVEVYDREQKEMVRLENDACVFEYRYSLFKKEYGRYIILRAALALSKEQKETSLHKEIEKELGGDGNVTYASHVIAGSVARVRARKLPDWRKIGTAGSFFKNPVVSEELGKRILAEYPDAVCTVRSDGCMKFAAGWLIDHVAEMRGVREGNVGTWEKQALVIVNEGRENAREIQTFVEKVQKMVYEKTGIYLEPEVVIVK